MTWEEACSILGIKESASPEEIRQRYLFKVNLLHSDRTQHLSERFRNEAEQELRLVNQAYELLSNPLNNPFKHPPEIKVTPSGIRFKDVEIGQKKTTSFQIDTIGGDYTNIWIDNNLPSWLIVKSAKSITDKLLPIEVIVECTGIGEPCKVYSFKLLVRLENTATKLKDEKKLEVELWTKETPVKKEDTVEVPPQTTGKQQYKYSFKAFFQQFAFMLILPFIPPILIATIFLLQYWKTPLFWVGAGVYLIASFVISDKKGKEAARPVTTLFAYTNTARTQQTSDMVIANKFSLMYHQPSCEWAKKISRNNRIYITKDEARTRGYSPCRVCRP